MTAKKLISLRISKATEDKLRWLAERHGTQTEVVAVAIDRLYESDYNKERAMTNIYEWRGPGWYASRGEGRNTTITHQVIMTGWTKEEAGEAARRQGLGTPRYHETQNDLRAALGLSPITAEGKTIDGSILYEWFANDADHADVAKLEIEDIRKQINEIRGGECDLHMTDLEIAWSIKLHAQEHVAELKEIG